MRRHRVFSPLSCGPRRGVTGLAVLALVSTAPGLAVGGPAVARAQSPGAPAAGDGASGPLPRPITGAPDTAAVATADTVTACQDFFKYVQQRYQYVMNRGWGKRPRPSPGARDTQDVLQAVVAR